MARRRSAIHVFQATSNTGVPSGLDLDNNGSVGGPNDALGFGTFPCQYGMLILSKYPLAQDQARTFQNFLWKDMPGALLPDDPNTVAPSDWYSADELDAVRLSSKSHWDVPVVVNGEIVHVLASHPTPPVFDGPEDRNGTRNHDEIRFWSDYVSPGEGAYIYDDDGEFGGLGAGQRFVILGDMNADPFDGDSAQGAVNQLLDNPQINGSATDASITPTSQGGPQQATLQDAVNDTHVGNPAFDTADFADGSPGNLRADYVLPSTTGLTYVSGQVFWPLNTDATFPLVGTYDPSLPGGFPSSDHRLVSVDLTVQSGGDDADRTVVAGLDFIGETSFATGTVFQGTEVGGLSGITYDAVNDSFYAISDDRSQIDPARFYTLNIDLGDGHLDAGDVTFTDVTTLTDGNGQPFPAFSLDPEGIALSSRGTVFISSEGDANNLINPFVNEFSLAGQQFQELPVPAAFLPTADGTSGIRNNLAFESLTLSPNGRYLFTATENALAQDGPAASVDEGTRSRIVQYDAATGAVLHQFIYETDPVDAAPVPATAFATNGLVELIALDDTGTLLALERSFSTGVGNGIKLYQVLTQVATDIKDFDAVGSTDIDAIAEKKLLLDFADLGITLDNLEGMSLGPPPVGRRDPIGPRRHAFGFRPPRGGSWRRTERRS
jgi:3-phytase